MQFDTDAPLSVAPSPKRSWGLVPGEAQPSNSTFRLLQHTVNVQISLYSQSSSAHITLFLLDLCETCLQILQRHRSHLRTSILPKLPTSLCSCLDQVTLLRQVNAVQCYAYIMGLGIRNHMRSTVCSLKAHILFGRRDRDVLTNAS